MSVRTDALHGACFTSAHLFCAGSTFMRCQPTWGKAPGDVHFTCLRVDQSGARRLIGAVLSTHVHSRACTPRPQGDRAGRPQPWPADAGGVGRTQILGAFSLIVPRHTCPGKVTALARGGRYSAREVVPHTDTRAFEVRTRVTPSPSDMSTLQLLCAPEGHRVKVRSITDFPMPRLAMALAVWAVDSITAPKRKIHTSHFSGTSLSC